MKNVSIQTSTEFAKEIVVAMMRGKEIDVKGMLTPLVIQADGQRISSNHFRILETRISIEEFTDKKEYYLKKNSESHYFGIILQPSFNICEEISKQLKMEVGYITFSYLINI